MGPRFSDYLEGPTFGKPVVKQVPISKRVFFRDLNGSGSGSIWFRPVDPGHGTFLRIKALELSRTPPKRESFA